MKTTLAVCLCLTLAGALGAQPANPLTTAVTQAFHSARMNLEESAALMPEDKYGFRLTESQRTFGEWIGHTIMANYNSCAGMKGEKPPAAAEQAHHLKAKAELTQAMQESFAFCSETLKTMDDQKALAPAGPNQPPPVRNMVGLLTLLSSHYGNMVGYLRTNNLTPPSTARAQKSKKSGPSH